MRNYAYTLQFYSACQNVWNPRHAKPLTDDCQKKANDGAPSGFPAKFDPVLVVLPLILNPFQLFSREFKVFQTRPREKSAGFSLYRSRAVVSWAAQPRGVGDNVPHFWDQRGTGGVQWKWSLLLQQTVFIQYCTSDWISTPLTLVDTCQVNDIWKDGLGRVSTVHPHWTAALFRSTSQQISIYSIGPYWYLLACTPHLEKWGTIFFTLKSAAPPTSSLSCPLQGAETRIQRWQQFVCNCARCIYQTTASLSLGHHGEFIVVQFLRDPRPSPSWRDCFGSQFIYGARDDNCRLWSDCQCLQTGAAG